MALSNEKRADAKRLIMQYHTTMSANKLAKLCGIGNTTCRRLCRELDVTCNSVQPNQIEDPRIVPYITEHWESMPISKMAAYFDVSETYINDKARKLGLPSKSTMVDERRNDPLLFVALNRSRMTQNAMSAALSVHKSEIKRLSTKLNRIGEPDLSDAIYEPWKARMVEQYAKQWSEQERAAFLAR